MLYPGGACKAGNNIPSIHANSKNKLSGLWIAVKSNLLTVLYLQGLQLVEILSDWVIILPCNYYAAVLWRIFMLVFFFNSLMVSQDDGNVKSLQAN